MLVWSHGCLRRKGPSSKRILRFRLQGRKHYRLFEIVQVLLSLLPPPLCDSLTALKAGLTVKHDCQT